jgi:hypothetical protein
MTDRTKPSFVIGILLILVGALYFLGELFKVSLTHLWPFFVIASGLVFFVAMFVAGKSTGYLAIPGSIIMVIGLLLLYQSLTGHWESWSYAWALIPFGVGAGLWIYGLYGGMESLRDAGRRTMGVGLVLFVVFGAFFELLIGISGRGYQSQIIWPAALIVLGVYLLLSRVFQRDSGVVTHRTAGTQAASFGADMHKEVVEPSSTAASETREFSGLIGVHHKGVGNMLITQGDRDELRIEGDPEVRSRILTDVKDGILVIRHDQDFISWLSMWTKSIDSLRFFLTIKDIRLIKLSGAGSIKAVSVKSDTLELVNSGAGSQVIDDLDVKEFKVELSGAGSMDVAGKCVDQHIKLSGAGSFNGSKLVSQNAEVKLSGVGSASVRVSGKLDANLSGVGSVEYYGDPQVTRKVTGIGNLKALGQ